MNCQCELSLLLVEGLQYVWGLNVFVTNLEEVAYSGKLLFLLLRLGLTSSLHLESSLAAVSVKSSDIVQY